MCLLHLSNTAPVRGGREGKNSYGTFHARYVLRCWLLSWLESLRPRVRQCLGSCSWTLTYTSFSYFHGPWQGAGMVGMLARRGQAGGAGSVRETGGAGERGAEGGGCGGLGSLQTVPGGSSLSRDPSWPVYPALTCQTLVTGRDGRVIKKFYWGYSRKKNVGKNPIRWWLLQLNHVDNVQISPP